MSLKYEPKPSTMNHETLTIHSSPKDGSSSIGQALQPVLGAIRAELARTGYEASCLPEGGQGAGGGTALARTRAPDPEFLNPGPRKSGYEAPCLPEGGQGAGGGTAGARSRVKDRTRVQVPKP